MAEQLAVEVDVNKSESQTGDALASLNCFRHILIDRQVTFVLNFRLASSFLIASSICTYESNISHYFQKYLTITKNISYLQRSQSHKIPMLKNSKISRSNVIKYQYHNILRSHNHTMIIPWSQSQDPKALKSQSSKIPISLDPKVLMSHMIVSEDPNILNF